MICPRDAARLDFCAGLKVAGMRGPFLCTSDPLVPRSRVFKQKAMHAGQETKSCERCDSVLVPIAFFMKLRNRRPD